MTDSKVAPRPVRRRGFLFPLLLICFGLLFFAANSGYLPPISARALLSLWPLIFIVWGVELLVARRQPFLALAIELVVIAGALGVLAIGPRTLFPGATQPVTSASVPREDAAALSLRLQGGGGTYTLRGGASALVEATADSGIEVTTSRGHGTADVRVKPPDQFGGLFTIGGTPPTTVAVRVASDVPTSLRVEVGAGDFTVDLREMNVRDARVETGASKLEVTLPRPTGDIPIRLQAGAATLDVVVPDGVEARITTTGGVISTSTLNPRFGGATGSVLARSGSSVETAGYAAAKDRVTVTIEAGASSITVR